MRIESVRAFGAVLLALAVAAAFEAAAQDDARRTMIMRKLEFAGRVLNDAGAISRIEAAPDARARKLLERGAVLYARARAELDAGRLDAADRDLSEALAALGQARRIARDTEAQRAHERARYAQLLSSTESLLESYRRHLLGRGALADASDFALAARLMQEARDRADADTGLIEALRTLEQAEQHLLRGIGHALGARTLAYAPRFATTREEFEFELSRYRALTELVPLAIEQLRPPEQARRRMQAGLERAESARRAALAQAELGLHRAALAAVREAIDGVQQALSAGGLVTPTR
ncbi:MAG: hypothetical protein JSW68_08940 [Burkholderiales bacterium]|nr:MAG: hypothetical protein JSW68_08940 [Burkholderiales bacterium]